MSISSAAPSGGVAISVTSSNAAVAAPGTVTVAQGAASSTFTVAIATVSSPQTAVLTAAANGVSATFSIQVNLGGPVLSVNATSVAFGNVAVNTSSTQAVILAAIGTQPVTVNSIAIAGTGFSLASVPLPMTLNPGQTATLNLSFLPTVVGAAAGQITITSNAINGGTVVIGLSGTAQTTYQVDLTWEAPANSSDPVVGYNVYRSTSGGGYRLLNAVVNVPVTFVDNNVQNGISYAYYVTSVDSAGNESSPSNTWSAAIP